jgi:hypothetical protein
LRVWLKTWLDLSGQVFLSVDYERPDHGEDCKNDDQAQYGKKSVGSKFHSADFVAKIIPDEQNDCKNDDTDNDNAGSS